MLRFDPKRLDTAFVQPGTPSFAKVMIRIDADTELTSTRRRDILSGLRRVAKALGLPETDVPADAQWLQPRLKNFLPASIGLSAKSWSNALSDVRAGLVRYGFVERRISRTSDLMPGWKILWEAVLASKDATLSRSLPRFVHFVNRLGIAPQEVHFGHFETYREAVTRNEISRDPDQAFRVAVNAWNLAGSRFPDWPQTSFTLPSRAKKIKLPIEAFPASFAADLERYLTGLRDPDLFDEEALDAPLRSSSITQYRAMLTRFASILTLADIPIARITELAALVQIDHAEAGLRWMRTEAGGVTTVSTADMANLLRNVARRYVKVGDGDQRRLDQLNDRLAMKQTSGMTPKNRERLRPLKDEATLRRFLDLPEALFERGIKGNDSLRAALEREDALAMAILRYCPIRRKNLFSIHLEHNLRRMGDGRVFLVFESGEVKNSYYIEFELQGNVVAMLDQYLKTRSPRLCPAGTPWLFALRDGSGPADLNYFGSKLKKRIGKEIGLTINVHLFRHIAALIWLETHPGQYEVLKRILGHKALSQTLNFYAGFEAGTSTRLFAAAIDELRRNQGVQIK